MLNRTPLNVWTFCPGLAFLFVGVQASYCIGGPSPNARPNTYPISHPKIVHVRDFVNAGSTNGRLFEVHHAAGNTTFPLLHLYGDPYAMGMAQGKLLKEKSINMWNGFWNYLLSNTPGGESALVQMLERLQHDSKSYIPSRFTDELEAGVVQFKSCSLVHCACS